jgi:hypothetical protein
MEACEEIVKGGIEEDGEVKKISADSGRIPLRSRKTKMLSQISGMRS